MTSNDLSDILLFTEPGGSRLHLKRNWSIYIIIFLVTAAHLAFILFMTFADDSVTPIAKTKLIVKTVQLNRIPINDLDALTKNETLSEIPESPVILENEMTKEIPQIPTEDSVSAPQEKKLLDSDNKTKKILPQPQEKSKNPTTISKKPKVETKKKISESSKKTVKTEKLKQEVKSIPKKQSTAVVTQQKPAEIKNSTSKPKTIDPVSEAKKAKQRELLAKAKENIAKVNQTKSNLIANSSSVSTIHSDVPARIGTLQNESISLNTEENNYRNEVALQLKQNLHLSEYGEVKIKITIERSGKVSLVEVVSYENERNKLYIEKTLPKLMFPSFGKNFPNVDRYTFTLLLNSEI